jgi:phosphatidylserine synthase
MVSNIRYPHLINRYLRGRRPLGRLLVVVILVLLFVVWPQYTLAIGVLIYAFWGPATWLWLRIRHRSALPPPAPLS